MDTAGVLADAFTRVQQTVAHTVDGLDVDALSYRIDPDANTIGWLVWHLTRVQDDHIADVAGTEQVWTAQAWDERFGLPFEEGATGYGHRSDDVAAVRVTAPLLADYHDAVCKRTTEYIRTLSDADLDQVVDSALDPPVTLGVRLISVISDDLQHAGQAAYIRGVLERS